MRATKKINLKEYNQYELRFLQVLIPKTLYEMLLIFNYNLRVERYLWHGDKLIMGHPDDKLEFIETQPDALESIIHATSGLKKVTAAGDYIDAIAHVANLLKKVKCKIRKRRCDYCEEDIDKKELRSWWQDGKRWFICKECADPSNWEPDMRWLS